MRPRRRTSTSNFGVGGRESHDATRFYERFRAPELSTDDTVAPPRPVAESFVCGDARHMDAVEDGSVALVVTSPPYFAGKQYEEELEREGVPSSYLEYLELLTDVFAECVRTLEPGGRIAVNVANLGRKPYRSLSSDVIRILEHDLGLLLRAEIIWQKGEGANGSCAWGSYRSAANPVLRDVTERVIVASKGRFDRARPARQRAAEGLPSESTVTTDDFLALTLDVWSIPAESARRVGHPAPFPVELPERLIRLYTFAGDLVLDPFMGSGSTLVAAAQLGRRYVGYDLDAGYVELARHRVDEVEQHDDGHRAKVLAEGSSATAVAEQVLVDAGFTVEHRDRRMPETAVSADLVATDAGGGTWCFVVAGPLTEMRGGLLRMEVVWRTLGQAAALRGRRPDVPVVVLTTDLPRLRSDGDTALHAAGPDVLFDVVDLLSDDGSERLRAYGAGGAQRHGFWTVGELAPGLIATLLPDIVAVVTAEPGDELEPLFPEEEPLVSSAVPARRHDFTAGRSCARAALRSLGVPEMAIVADDRRAPQWPEGVVGSITHCAGFTAAAAARRCDVAMLGIDAEPTGTLDEAELVVSAGERRRAGAVIGPDADRVLFSAKESIYKAWYPATKRWLDFHDVTVVVQRDGSFIVEPGEHLDPERRAVLASLRGRFAITAEHVFTAVHAPA